MSGITAATGLIGEATDSMGLTGEGGIFGDAPQVQNRTPQNINLPGLSVNRNGRTIDVNRTGEVTSVLEDIRGARDQQAGMLRDQAETVGPAVNRLTEARQQILDAERSRTMGNVREQLGRRRVLGSSFGADAMARTGAEFGMQQAEAEAEGELQALQTETDLLNQAFQSEIQGVQTELDQLNVDAQVGQNIAGMLTGLNQDVAQTNKMLQQQHGQAQAQFFGNIIGSGARMMSGGMG